MSLFKSVLLITFFSLFNNCLFAQDFKLGKVTVDELKEAYCEKDSTAPAAILFKVGETKFELNSEGSWNILTEINCKIKIYKKEGLEYANQRFSYYENEKININKAFTFNLVDGEVVKTKLKSEGEFDEKVNEKWSIKKIVFPNVNVGSIVEFSYQLRSPYITEFDDWRFQTDIPVNYVSYNVYMPEYFKYRTVISGYENIKTNKELISTGDFGQNKYTYIGENLPAINSENHVINKDNYCAILKCELASINYPNQPIKSVSLSWNDVVKSIYESENFGGQLEISNYFKEDLDVLLQGTTSRNEKIGKVYSFVKNWMVWDGKHGIYTNRGVKSAYKTQTGSASEINLMLVAMLRYAGIQANPIILSTRDNGIPIFPTRTAFNYVVAGVEVLNDVILLDATDKKAIVDLLPIKTLNWSGKIIREHGSYADINLLDVKHSDDKVMMLLELTEAGRLKGKIRRNMTAYNAYLFRDKYFNLSEESYLDGFENRNKGLSITNYKLTNLKELDKPIIEDFDFEYTNGIDVIGDKIYISPLLFFTIRENPFKQNSRLYPVDFVFPYKDNFMVSLKVPDGYEIDFLPQTIQMATEKNYCNFSFKISSNDISNTVQLIADFNVNTFMVPSDSYQSLKEFYKLVVDKQNEKIVLKKKS